MPATSGVNFLIRVGNSRQTVTLSGGGGTDDYRLNFRGQQTANIDEAAAASAVQTALEALSTIGAGNVAVSGSAGGPYTVTFQGTLAGQDVELMTASNTTGGLAVAIAATTATYTTLGGQRGATLRRAGGEADATAKDSSNWHVGLPTIREWGIEGDAVALEDDAAFLALERAFLNPGTYRVVVDIQTPAGNTYRGVGTLTDFPVEGAHDDVLMVSLSVTGSGVLTKV